MLLQGALSKYSFDYLTSISEEWQLDKSWSEYNLSQSEYARSQWESRQLDQF